MRDWRRNLAITFAPIILIAMMLGAGLLWLAELGLARPAQPSYITLKQENPWVSRVLPGKVVTLLQSLDSAPSVQRDAIIAAAQEPGLRIHILDAPTQNAAFRADADSELLKNRVEALLASPRKILVAERSLVPGTRTASVTDLRELRVQVTLADGHWLTVERRFRPIMRTELAQASPSTLSIATAIALGGVLCALLSIIAARLISRPLSELSHAAGHVGGSGEAVPVRVSGPREIATLMQAFNRMQDRIRRFNEDRTRMFASMSHDLRTPLTRLRLRIEINEDIPDQKKMLAELDGTNSLIESILSFAEEDAKRESHSLLDVSALVEGICQDASDLGEPVTFSGPRGVNIIGRPIALRRAVFNLVDNAIKYGKTALVTLRLQADQIVITVEDEGPGIPWAQRDKVFEPFYRMDEARDPNTGGVGLGLSVTRSIVLEHGGEIALCNRRGGGLCVRVKLAVAADQLAASPSESDPERHVGESRLKTASA